MPGIKEMLDNLERYKEEEQVLEKTEGRLDSEQWDAWHEWLRQIREEIEDGIIDTTLNTRH